MNFHITSFTHITICITCNSNYNSNRTVWIVIVKKLSNSNRLHCNVIDPRPTPETHSFLFSEVPHIKTDVLASYKLQTRDQRKRYSINNSKQKVSYACSSYLESSVYMPNILMHGLLQLMQILVSVNVICAKSVRE